MRLWLPYNAAMVWKAFLIILALVTAPLLTALDMGQAQAAGHAPAAMDGCCDRSGPMHHDALPPHGGIACVVACASVAVAAVLPAGPSLSQAVGLSLPIPQQSFPAVNAWPPPLRPPRA